MQGSHSVCNIKFKDFQAPHLQYSTTTTATQKGILIAHLHRLSLHQQLYTKFTTIKH